MTGFYGMELTNVHRRKQDSKELFTLITLRSFSEPLTPRMLSLCNNCTRKSDEFTISRKTKRDRHDTHPLSRQIF